MSFTAQRAPDLDEIEFQSFNALALDIPPVTEWGLSTLGLMGQSTIDQDDDGRTDEYHPLDSHAGSFGGREPPFIVGSMVPPGAMGVSFEEQLGHISSNVTTIGD